MAMEAIRKVNPDAKLIQTEDLGRLIVHPYYNTRQNLKIIVAGYLTIYYAGG
jgi:hypothetical protein